MGQLLAVCSKFAVFGCALKRAITGQRTSEHERSVTQHSEYPRSLQTTSETTWEFRATLAADNWITNSVWRPQLKKNTSSPQHNPCSTVRAHGQRCTILTELTTATNLQACNIRHAYGHLLATQKKQYEDKMTSTLTCESHEHPSRTPSTCGTISKAIADTRLDGQKMVGK